MKRIKSLVGIFAFSLLVLALPAAASAQWGGNNRNDDDYYGNNRNGGGRYDNRALKSTVVRLKNSSKDFDRRLERELDRNRNDRWGNNRRNNSAILNLTEDFKKAADDLEDDFGNGRNLRNTEDEARQVLQLGAQLERELRNSRFNFSFQNDWNAIRQDLQMIANGYGLRYNGGGRFPNGNNNGTWRDRLPVQLPF